MSKPVNLSKPMKVLSILLGTLTCGFMWRCRGEGGWGSFWGLCAVGTAMTLLIYAFYGNKGKMKYEHFFAGPLMLGAGVTGYATIIEQMSGLEYSFVPYGPTGEIVSLPIDAESAVWMMLIMGFTLAPLFCFFVGTLFSKKEYKIYHFLIAIAVFYAVSYLMKATAAPYIMNAVNPDQTALAAKGLAAQGIDLAPRDAYMQHFGDRGWAEDYAFFENYYMSVESISNAIAALAVYLVALIAWKDRVASIGSFFMNLIMAVGTTVFDAFLVMDYDTGIFADVTAPSFLKGGNWGLWEYATGASLGFGIMLVIALLPKKYTEQSTFKSLPLIKNKIIRFAYCVPGAIFVFGVVPFRALGIAGFRLFEDLGYNIDGDTVGTIVCAVLSVILGIFIIIKMKKTVLDNDMPMPFEEKPKLFSAKVYPAYMTFCFLVYFLFASSIFDIGKGIFEGTDGAGDFFSRLAGNEGFLYTVMFVSFVLIMAIYMPVSKKLRGKR